MNIPFDICAMGDELPLPGNYMRLDFLEFTGTQWIDTALWGLCENAFVAFKGKAKAPSKRAFQGSGFAYCSVNATQTFTSTGNESLQSYFAGYLPDNRTIPYSFHTVIGINYFHHNKQNYNKNSVKIDGADFREIPSHSLKLGTYFDGSSYNNTWWVGTCENFKARLANGFIHLIPALSPEGNPCMFDLVSNQAFFNKGTKDFIVGINKVSRLVDMLQKLPVGGGQLTLSLPKAANTANIALLMQQTYNDKGWNLTVREYRTTSTPYTLRRMREVVWCRRERCDSGNYVDVSGTYWNIEYCAAIFGPYGQNPAEYGYEPFDSIKQAAEAWQLTPTDAFSDM